MAKYINLNSTSLPSLNNDSSSIFSRVRSAGSSLSSNTLLLIGGIILFVIALGILGVIIQYET